ncbi:MAG: RNB domain-containing ribonuclease [Spirochaetaceae bacterium]|jgi:exoribonuclease-2|nr:RNB domain-containing ribonuclease [Spirochaetaceae bacterium]
MLKTQSLCVYKQKPAIVTAIGEKIAISLADGGDARVRMKDIELLHEGPLSSFDKLEDGAQVIDVREVWELCLAEYGAADKKLSLRDLAELAYGTFTPAAAWAAYTLLYEGIYFDGPVSAIRPRPAADVEATEQKKNEKHIDSTKRADFIKRLHSGEIDIEADAQYFQDIAALALGKAVKSRSLREAGIEETPYAAYRLLLGTGYWKPSFNPHPCRYGVSLLSADTPIHAPPEEERIDLTSLPAFAIDNEWSDDPDDALFFEPDGGGGGTLYIHVSDPAASVRHGTEADNEALARGVTFYAPESISRMITPDALPVFALGLSETSPALTFKLGIRPDCTIRDIDIFRSTVRVSRLTYANADNDERIAPLIALAAGNLEKRLNLGATLIEFPDVRVTVNGEQVEIVPQEDYVSTSAVRECMLLAGEAAARWALERRLPFPYIMQEPGDIPSTIYEGLAGSYQLRRCMRPRSLSTKPGLHWGLGLDAYSQVTSPLRRYTDLLAHQQIRAVLRGEPPLDEETLLLKLGAAERATVAAVRADRATALHWKLVYLLDKQDSVWDAVMLEKSSARAVMFIPALGMEIACALNRGQKDLLPNDSAKLKLKSVKLAESAANFVFD